MAFKTGQKTPSLAPTLLRDPRKFSFYGAVHLLETANPEAAPVGYLGPPSRECLRLRPSVSMSFPEADLEEVETIEVDGKNLTRLTTTFLGLYGVTSPIPLFYAEELLRDVLDAPEGQEPATRAFLDIIHHRLLSLLYRCWKKYRYLYQKDTEGRDPLTRHLLCLVGLDHGTGSSAESRAHLRLLSLAGLITQQPRSAAGLEAFLRGLLGHVPLQVEQCTPSWMEIPADQHTVLGRSRAILGEETVAGQRILSAGNHFTLRLGPLSREEFRKFLPCGPGFALVVGLGRFFVGLALEFTVELVLKRDQAGPLPLGKTGMGRLGWDAWLFSRQPEEELHVKLRAPTLKGV